MIKKFAYLFAVAATFSFCVDSNQIQLPETATSSQSRINFQDDKKLNTGFLNACDKFYYDGIIGTGGATSINTFLKSFNNENKDEKFDSKEHQIAYVQAAKYLISAGIMASTLDDVNSIAGEMAKWFDFGKSIGQYIQNNPTELLRVEIKREKLYELLQKIAINNKDDIEKYIQNDSKGFDSVFVSTNFLETVHTSKSNELSDSKTKETILEENAKAGKYTWAGKIVNGINFTGSAKILIAAIKDDGERLLKIGTLPMVPNLIDSSLQDILNGKKLTEAEKNWCVCKAAIRYLYENPEATIKDAVTASINIVQGMLSDNGNYTHPLGNTIDARKSDAILYLEMIHARDLCQVGRWKEHVGFIKQINTTIIKKRDEVVDYKTQTKATNNYFFPELQKYNAKKQTIPVVMKNLTMYNNNGAGHCGIYATLFQSRADLVKWLKTKPDWEQYLPDYLKNANSSGYLSILGFSPLLDKITVNKDGYFTETLYENIQAANFNKKIINEYSEDFRFISTLHNRPMQMWAAKQKDLPSSFSTDINSPNNLANFIQPDQNIENSSRARMIHWYYNGSNHYQSLLERHDYIGFAKLIRHNP